LKNGIIFTVLLHIVLYSEHMFVKGTFDLDQDQMSEILLFTENNLRYVEMDAEGQHRLLWGLTPENYSIKDAFIFDLENDGIYELVVLADYFPGFRAESNDWLKLFSWHESQFEPANLKLKNKQLLYPNIGDFELDSEKITVAMGSPSRTVSMVRLTDTTTVNTIDLDLPESLHNGIGHLSVSFLNIGGDSHLAVFSNENELLNTVLFNVEGEPEIIAEASLTLHGTMNLLAPAIIKTDLDRDLSEELQLPLASGDVLTLSYVDSALALAQSKFSGKQLFTVADTAAPETINNVLLSRMESGLMNQLAADKVIETPVETEEIDQGSLESGDTLMVKVEEDTLDGFPTAMEIIPDDSLKLGDTLFYRATADTGTGFYSFNWLAQPPDSAFFDPATGYISWIPTREQLGIHVFKYATEISMKDELLSDMDDIGDRHRMVPIIEEKEQSYSVMVVDTTKPPIVYVPPPDEPYMVSVYTPGKTEGSERFVFEGEPPFHVMVDEIIIPDLQQVTHSISANLGGLTNNKFVDFSYSSNVDSLVNFITLTVEHDLENNTIFARVDPPPDTTEVTLIPADWRPELHVYPSYHFYGFPESVRLGESEQGISLYKNEQDKESANFSYISINTPRGEDGHNMTIRMSAVELWNIRGDVTVDSSEGKTVSTSITFSGEFDLFSVSAEMHPDTDFAKRVREMKFKALEYMGVDSVAVNSTGVETP